MLTQHAFRNLLFILKIMHKEYVWFDSNSCCLFGCFIGNTLRDPFLSLLYVLIGILFFGLNAVLISGIVPLHCKLVRKYAERKGYGDWLRMQVDHVGLAPSASSFTPQQEKRAGATTMAVDPGSGKQIKWIFLGLCDSTSKSLISSFTSHQGKRVGAITMAVKPDSGK